MPDVSQNDAVFSIEKVVVFDVAGDVQVCSRLNGFPDEKGSGASADGDSFDLGFAQGGMPDRSAAEDSFYPFQKFPGVDRFVQFTDDAETCNGGRIVYADGVPLFQNLPVREFQFVRHLSADAVQYGVHVGVGRINVEVVFDGPDETAFYPAVGQEVFQGLDAQRMMADDQVEIAGNGFLDDGFRHIGAEQYGGYFAVGAPADQPGVVVTLLQA